MTARWPLIAALALVAVLSGLRLLPGAEPAPVIVRILSAGALVVALAGMAGLLLRGRK